MGTSRQVLADELRVAWRWHETLGRQLQEVRDDFVSYARNLIEKEGWSAAEVAREIGISRQRLHEMLKRGSS